LYKIFNFKQTKTKNGGKNESSEVKHGSSISFKHGTHYTCLKHTPTTHTHQKL